MSAVTTGPVDDLGRWAVKEATYKAFGRWRLDFRDIRVASSDQYSTPQLVLQGYAATKAEELGIANKHVSISHDGDYATAQVILERTDS